MCPASRSAPRGTPSRHEPAGLRVIGAHRGAAESAHGPRVLVAVIAVQGPGSSRARKYLLRPRRTARPHKSFTSLGRSLRSELPDAVALQGDMNVVGVVKTRPDFEAKLAVRKAYALYAATDDALRKFEKAGVKASGVLGDALKDADLVVDCTPEESGYKKVYEKAGVKAIWQGGEDHALTNLSFTAAANYDECLGASFVRVPSCNASSRSWCAARRTPATRRRGRSTRSSRSSRCRATTDPTFRASSRN